MPPRVPLRQATRCAYVATKPLALNSFPPTFSSLSIQCRQAHILASLSDNRGAYHKKIRLGRGPSSGKGKTSGRGQKGQKAHGHVHPWFQGGQTPLIRIKGEHGFINKRKLSMIEVNLSTIQKFIDTGRLDPLKQISPKELFKSRLVTRYKDGIKLLAGGKEDLRSKINIVVSRASSAAIEAVEARGGTITTRYFTEGSMRQLVKGESLMTDRPLPTGEKNVRRVLQEMDSKNKFYKRLPDPTSRKAFEYYRDPAHRGYLAHTLGRGESPSLYYKVPHTNMGNDRVITRKQIDKNKLW